MPPTLAHLDAVDDEARDMVPPGLLREVEDREHQLHRVRRSALAAADRGAVDGECRRSAGPLDRVRVELPYVDRQPYRLEVLRYGGVADGLQTHADRSGLTGNECVAEHLH